MLLQKCFPHRQMMNGLVVEKVSQGHAYCVMYALSSNTEFKVIYSV